MDMDLKLVRIEWRALPGQLIEAIPFDPSVIADKWVEMGKHCDMLGIEPLDPANPLQDPKEYHWVRGRVEECSGAGMWAFRMWHARDAGIGERQAEVYRQLVAAGYRFSQIVEKQYLRGWKHEWVAYFVLGLQGFLVEEDVVQVSTSGPDAYAW
jgi:hypothetical protein